MREREGKSNKGEEKGETENKGKGNTEMCSITNLCLIKIPTYV